MGRQVDLDQLYQATEEDVARALGEGSYVKPPLSKPEDLLEFFSRMLYVLVGPADD